MDFNEKEKNNVSFYLGMKTDELFDCFYVAIKKRMFLKDGIFNASAKKIKISIGDHFSDIKLAWGHPVFLSAFANKSYASNDDYRYFIVNKRSIRNLRKTCAPIFEADTCKFYIKNELNKNSPELNKEFLLKIAKATPIPGLKDKVIDFLNEKELIEYLSQYDDYDYTLRQIAVSRIKNQNFLLNKIFDENECAVVKRAAVLNIKDAYSLIEIILLNSKEYLVMKESFWKICKLCEQGIISRGVLLEIVTTEELPISIRYNALVRLNKKEIRFFVDYEGNNQCNYYNNEDRYDDTLDCPISERIKRIIRSFKS